MQKMDNNEKMMQVLEALEYLTRLALSYSSKSRSCAILERLSRRLLDILRETFMIFNKIPSQDFVCILTELSWQLRNVKGLVMELGTQPAVYRTLTAVRSRAKCLQVCRSIGLSLEGLKSLRDQLDAADDSVMNALEQLSQLATAFQHAEFPLQRMDVQFFQATEDISTKIFDGRVPLSEGLQQIKEHIHGVIDANKIKEHWKNLALLLFRDVDRARSRGDTMEEHSIRLLLWAINGGIQAPPPEFLCPLSLRIMQEPVILCESEITYEKKEIQAWLAKDDEKRCPVSLKKLKNCTVAENKAIKALTSDWLRTKTAAEQASATKSLKESKHRPFQERRLNIQCRELLL